jgi:hypothetical protein
MAKVWTIYKFASELTWPGVVAAKTEEEAIEIASKEFKVAPNRLIARADKVRQAVSRVALLVSDGDAEPFRTAGGQSVNNNFTPKTELRPERGRVKPPEPLSDSHFRDWAAVFPRSHADRWG